MSQPSAAFHIDPFLVYSDLILAPVVGYSSLYFRLTRCQFAQRNAVEHIIATSHHPGIINPHQARGA